MTGITRRGILAAFPATLSAWNTISANKTKPLPNAGEFLRFADPVTETTVTRLTNPTSRSLLPGHANRFVSMKERALFFSSDRTGTLTPFRLDLRTAVVTPLAETPHLDPASLCLDAQERYLYLLDEGRLREIALNSKRNRQLAEGISAFGVLASPGEFVAVRRGELQILGGNPITAASDVASWCLPRPRSRGCVFGRDTAPDESEFWYADFTGTEKPKLLAKGRITNPFWSPDGSVLLFLRDVPGRDALLSEIHQVTPEAGAEDCVSPTSQFASFAPNGNGSVFVGASRSKAQPTIILLLRSPHREFTLCEHRASHPASASPVFSPDSRRVYFESDREGKPALYAVNVELIVEPTPAV